MSVRWGRSGEGKSGEREEEKEEGKGQQKGFLQRREEGRTEEWMAAKEGRKKKGKGER